MIKFVLEDYRARFWPAFKAYINSAMIYFCWIYIYIAFMMEVNFIKYTIGIIPMLTGLFLSRMYPNQLQKLLFLCPLSEDDRKKYMITAYAVRVGISMTVYMAASLPAMIAGYICIFEWIEAGLLTFIFVSGVNMHHPLLSIQITRTEEDKDYWPSFIYGMLSILSQIVSWCAMIIFSSVAVKEIGGQLGSSSHTGMIGAIIIELLLNIAIFRICYKRVMGYAMNYEKCRGGILQNENCNQRKQQSGNL